MDSATFLIETKNHQGPLKIELSFYSKREGDIAATFARDKDKLNDDDCILKFSNKLKIKINPNQI